MTLSQLFIDRTVMANNAKTSIERMRLLAERTGIGDCIAWLHGSAAHGEAIMAADRYYMDRGFQSRSMTGGVWHDWHPEHTHVNRGDGTDICKECGEDLRHECHRRIA